MTPPDHPPLNGRNLAEYYVATESAKLATLREYAKPPEEQAARVLMYDPIRKFVRDYFRSGRGADVLERASEFHRSKQFANPEYNATYHKSNEAAIENLRKVIIAGDFHEVIVARASMYSNGLRILSTADFHALYVPKARNGKSRRVSVIVNPSGVKRPPDKRKAWLNIESEVAMQAALSSGFEVDEVIYVDLQKQDVYRHSSPKRMIKSEIDATCYRLLRDWREIRLSMTLDNTGTA